MTTIMKPLIFISNDDGVNAKGLNELIALLKDEADLIVMAPDGPRSGASAAITSVVPVGYKKISEEPGLSVYSCSGTPVDCVKLAFETVLSRKPDLVLSGINHGDNASVNVHYSGTMGVAFEGCLKGIPSIGLSLADARADADFSPFYDSIRMLVHKVLADGLPVGVCLNVNFPNTQELKGVRICQQAKGQWVNEWENFAHRGDSHYYWLTGEFEDADADNEKNDHWALANGYVAITPTTVDVTAYGLIDELKAWFSDDAVLGE